MMNDTIPSIRFAEHAATDASRSEGRSGLRVPRDIYAVHVCGDCAVWSANADDSGAGDDWSPEQYALGLAEYGVDAVLTLSDHDQEPHFRAAQCSVCGGLPGDQYAATVDAIRF